MKVMWLLFVWERYSSDVGGAEALCKNLCEGLTDMGSAITRLKPVVAISRRYPAHMTNLLKATSVLGDNIR